jgi:hypothetical protein
MAPRHYLFLRDFSRRLKDDGTADSICLHCFATLGYAADDERLEELEDAHICRLRRPAAPDRNSLHSN